MAATVHLDSNPSPPPFPAICLMTIVVPVCLLKPSCDMSHILKGTSRAEELHEVWGRQITTNRKHAVAGQEHFIIRAETYQFRTETHRCRLEKNPSRTETCNFQEETDHARSPLDVTPQSLSSGKPGLRLHEC